MLCALIYLCFGAGLSAFMAGRYMSADNSYGRPDNTHRFFFCAVGVVLWPILVPALMAFKAGDKRKK